jgi:hypothetical protein
VLATKNPASATAKSLLFAPKSSNLSTFPFVYFSCRIFYFQRSMISSLDKVNYQYLVLVTHFVVCSYSPGEPVIWPNELFVCSQVFFSNSSSALLKQANL